MGLDILTTIHDLRIIEHELNCIGAAIGPVPLKGDLEAGDGFKFHLEVQLFGAGIERRSRLGRITHEPTAITHLVNIGHSGKTECEIKAWRHHIIVSSLTEDVTDVGNELRHNQG